MLVVDDNVDSAELLATLLRLLGHQVEVVTDPREAVAVATRMNPDVAFVDIGMPHIDGFQLGALLRKKCGARLCLVALTAYGSDEDRESSKASGFDAHLVKPADLQMIEEVLQTLLGKG